MIKKLNSEEIKQIKSYSELKDLSECVLQLVYNSIDASSDLIHVSIDLNTFSCTVYDNGIGISKDGLNLIGERYVTSKLDCIDDLTSLLTFGYHGESLCNMIQLSDQFDLISRSKDSKESCFYQKKFTNNKLDHQIRKLDYQSKDFANIATIVRVRNLFGQDILRQQQLKGDLGKQLSSLLKKIETISVIHFNIEIIVLDCKKKISLFHSKKHENLKDAFLSHFDSSNHQFIKDFQLKQNNYQINGIVSVIGRNHELFSSNFQSAKLQLIYVNNKYFVENKAIRDYVAKKLSSCHLFNLARSEPKHMVFCISVLCPTIEYTWTKIDFGQCINFKSQLIYNILESFIHLFLIKYEFKKTIADKVIASEKPKPIKRNYNEIKDIRVSKLVKNQVYQRENVLKAVNTALTNVNDVSFDPKLNTESDQKHQPLKKKFNFSGLKSVVERKYSKKYPSKSTQTEITSVIRKQNDKQVKLLPNWIFHKNAFGVEFYLNTVDGSTTYDLTQVKIAEANDSMLDNIIKNQNKLENMRYFLRNFETNRDRIFQNGFENKILNEKSTDLNALLEEKMILTKWRNREDLIKQQKIQNSNSCANFFNIGSSKLDRSLFYQIKTIGQLDKKYIISYTKNQNNGMDSYSLVIFDQHAVHERIRLEELYLNNYDSKNGCISSEKLIEPFKLSIKLIKEYEFEKFCLSMKKIGFSISFLCAESNEIQIKIDRVPTIFAKKSKTNQQSYSITLKKLIDNQLHKLFLADFKIDDKSFSIFDIPNEILDAFNMEACKSAVKFGDELSKKQCRHLVASLAKTQNWLYCAHGRPTVLPLTNIFNPNEKIGKINFKNLMI